MKPVPQLSAEDQVRVMPEPFYVGSPHSTMVMFVLSTEGEFAPILRDGCRRLGRFILPPFQRPPVWTQAQQIALLESIWLELPIGSFVYNASNDMDDECDQWLIDGQQRITALLAYVADAFPVFGYRYSELSVVEKRGFSMKSFPCIETKDQNRCDLENIYNRLAYGGTPHSQ